MRGRKSENQSKLVDLIAGDFREVQIFERMDAVAVNEGPASVTLAALRRFPAPRWSSGPQVDRHQPGWFLV